MHLFFQIIFFPKYWQWASWSISRNRSTIKNPNWILIFKSKTMLVIRLLWNSLTQKLQCRKGVPVVKGGQNLPPGWNKVNWSAKNWGEARASSASRFRHHCSLQPYLLITVQWQNFGIVTAMKIEKAQFVSKNKTLKQ